jgi:catechol-2,3-dioxygenase
VKRPVKGLGEIALRVRDLDKMQLFYEQVVGLQSMRRFEAATPNPTAPAGA